MSSKKEVENLEYSGTFSRVSTTKGDILISDGTTFQTETVGMNTYVLTADSSTGTGVEWAPVDDSQVIRVGKNSDITTIKDGIAAAALLLPDKVIVEVSPGIYSEDNPLVIPEGVSVISRGGRIQTRINALNPGSNIIELSLRCEFNGFVLAGTTQYALTFDGSVGVGLGSCIVDCSVFGCTNGFLVEGSPGELIIFNTLYRTISGVPMTDGILVQSSGSVRLFDSGAIGFDDVLTNAFRCTGTGSSLIFRGGSTDTVTNAFVVENDAALETDSVLVQNSTNGYVIQGTGSPLLVAFNVIIKNSSSSDLNITATTAIVNINGGILRKDLINNPNNIKIFAYFFSATPGDEHLQVLGEFHVGTETQPAESVFGEGDSYTNDMAIFNDDGSGTNFMDISSSVADPLTNILLFQGTGVGNVLYIGGNIIFQGIKTLTETAWGVGDSDLITIEYFDGTWTSLDIMVTKATPPFDTRTTKIFETTDDEQIRFGPVTGWITTTVNGTSKYWFRITITGGVVSAIPNNRQIKLGPSRVEINQFGFREYFGKSRVVDSLKWDASLFQPANNSPANGDVYISDQLNVGRKDNLFEVGVVDRSGFNTFLPPNVDTSYGIKFTWAWVSNATGGDVEWEIRWGYTNDQGGTVSNIFPNAAAAPGTGPNQQNFTLITTANAVNQQKNEVVSIDILNLNPYPVGRSSDLLWLTIQRTGTSINDTLVGDVRIIQVDGRYVKWNDGGNIELF